MSDPHKFEIAFDHLKRMLRFARVRPSGSLALPVVAPAKFFVLCLAGCAVPHSGVADSIFCHVWAFFNPMAGRMIKDNAYLAPQQNIGLSNIADMAGFAARGMYQSWPSSTLICAFMQR